MSLRDDLAVLYYQKTGREAEAREAAYDRLRAALTPAAEKWLEALPELLERLHVEPFGLHPVCDLDYALRTALREAATLHNTPKHGDKDAHP